MKCCEMDSRSLFLFGARILFGAWLLYLGIGKIFFMGCGNFVQYIVTQFAQTWSPPVLTTLLASAILAAEPILGILLLVGKKSRCVWTLTTLFMFMLMFGQTMLMKYDVVASNWMYTIFCLACAALSSPESSACCSQKAETEKTGCCSHS